MSSQQFATNTVATQYKRPNRRRIEQFSEKVCEILAVEDPSYSDPQYADGLTQFLDIVATVLERDLNTKNSGIAI